MQSANTSHCSDTYTTITVPENMLGRGRKRCLPIYHSFQPSLAQRSIGNTVPLLPYGWIEVMWALLLCLCMLVDMGVTKHFRMLTPSRVTAHIIVAVRRSRQGVNCGFKTRLLLSPAGPAADSSTKKSKPGLASGPASSYNPSDSSQLPAWITERVRICQRLPAAHPDPPHPNPQLNQPAPAQEHQQQQQLQSSAGFAPSQPDSSRPEFVLYWMRTAIRGHENPALDVAKHEAKQQGLPLLVAAFVLTTHPYPTARRFKFWLEGLRDTQRELRAQASAHLSLGTCSALHACRLCM